MGDDGTRCRCILDLARVIDYAFPLSDLVDSGYTQRAVEAARHAALEELRGFSLRACRVSQNVNLLSLP